MPEPPAFAEPWQAQAFAMQVTLLERGLFSAREWAETLGAAIRTGEAAGEPADGSAYWTCWVRALEAILSAKGLASPVLIEARAASLAAARPGEHAAQPPPVVNQ